jgi:hypothetical protein
VVAAVSALYGHTAGHLSSWPERASFVSGMQKILFEVRLATGLPDNDDKLSAKMDAAA